MILTEKKQSTDSMMALLMKRFQSKNHELERVGCNETDYISNEQSLSNTVQQFGNEEEKKRLVHKGSKGAKVDNKRPNRF